MSKVIVIGGGAAGMMAAIGAAYNGNTVELLEKNEINNFVKALRNFEKGE